MRRSWTTAAPGATVGRPHIADALVAKGVVATRDDAFADYLYTGSPYHASHYAPDPVTAVRLVNGAGGVAGDGAPVRRAAGSPRRRRGHRGAWPQRGWRAWRHTTATTTPADVAHAEEMARRLGLFVTGSSDYHGAGKVNLLGENTTAPAVLAPDRGAGVRRPRRLAVSRGRRPQLRPDAPHRRIGHPVSDSGSPVRPVREGRARHAPYRPAPEGPRRSGTTRGGPVRRRVGDDG